MYWNILEVFADVSFFASSIESALMIFLFNNALLKYLNLQYLHMATATRTLEPSKIHQICINKWYYHYIGTVL